MLTHAPDLRIFIANFGNYCLDRGVVKWGLRRVQDYCTTYTTCLCAAVRATHARSIVRYHDAAWGPHSDTPSRPVLGLSLKYRIPGRVTTLTPDSIF